MPLCTHMLPPHLRRSSSRSARALVSISARTAALASGDGLRISGDLLRRGVARSRLLPLVGDLRGGRLADRRLLLRCLLLLRSLSRLLLSLCRLSLSLDLQQQGQRHVERGGQGARERPGAVQA